MPSSEGHRVAPRREALVRGAVAQRRDRDRVVRPAGAVREAKEIEEPRVVVLPERRHPTVAERRFELVFVATRDSVDLVQQQQHGTSLGE